MYLLEYLKKNYYKIAYPILKYTIEKLKILDHKIKEVV